MTTVYRRYHLASHLTVWVSILANAVAELDALILLIGTVGVGASFIMFRDRLLSPMPRWVANTMLVAALVLMFRAATGELADAVSVVAQYLVYLQLIKLFESRTPRDQAQLIMLSLLVSISAVLTSVTLQVALVLLMYLPLAFWTIVLYQLYSGQLRSHARRVEAGLAKPETPPAHPMDRPIRRTIRRLIASTLVGVSATAAVVFLLMPRDIGGGAFGDWQPASYGTSTGFNNEVRLGRPGTITESPAVVLEATILQRLSDGGTNPYRANQTHRLRGAVLDDFDHSSSVWYRTTRAESEQQHIRVYNDDRFPSSYESEAANIELRVSIRNLNSSELFTIWKPQEIAVPGSRRRITISPVDGQIRYRNHRGPVNYAVLVAPDAPAILRERDRRTIFERPSDNIFAAPDSRIRALALEIIGDRVPEFDPDNPRSVLLPGVSESIVSYLEDHLSTNYAYTLDMMVLEPDQDPIEAFLFENPAGHCEYFASALAALCRSVWIDARVVTGFLATEYNSATQSYTVRQSHAHAWVEAMVDRRPNFSPTDLQEQENAEYINRPDEGIEYIETWKTYDPSPRLSLQAIHSPPTGFIPTLRQWFDRLQFAWSSNVIGFDRERQNDLLRADSEGPLGIFERARNLAEGIDSDRVPGGVREDLIRSVLSFATVAALGAMLIGAAFVARAVLKTIAGRRSARRTEYTDPDRAERARQVRFFHRALELLDRAGLPRPSGVPASVHAASLRATAPDAADALGSLAMLYYESRYGRRLLTEQEMDQARSSLDRLRDSLPRKRP